MIIPASTTLAAWVLCHAKRIALIPTPSHEDGTGKHSPLNDSASSFSQKMNQLPCSQGNPLGLGWLPKYLTHQTSRGEPFPLLKGQAGWQDSREGSGGTGYLTHTLSTNLLNVFGFRKVKAQFTQNPAHTQEFVSLCPTDSSKLFSTRLRVPRRPKLHSFPFDKLQVKSSAPFHK